jgi:protein TonB
MNPRPINPILGKRGGRLYAPHLNWTAVGDDSVKELPTTSAASYIALGVVIMLHAGLIVYLIFGRSEPSLTVEMKSEGGPLRVQLVSQAPQRKPEPPKPKVRPEQPKPVPKSFVSKPKAKALASKSESTRSVEAPETKPPTQPERTVAAAASAPTPSLAPASAAAVAPAATAPARVPATAPTSDTPKDVSKGDCRTPVPDYPRSARMRGITGTVLVRLVIDEEGHVSATVNRSSGTPELDQSALDAALAADCNPYRENGRPIKAAAVQTFKFSLSQ